MLEVGGAFHLRSASLEANHFGVAVFQFIGLLGLLEFIEFIELTSTEY
jgi:hypothetical protein